MPGSLQAASAAPLKSGNDDPPRTAPHQRAGFCRRRAAATTMWVFILDAPKRDHSRWYWARGGAEALKSACGFPSFAACVADARSRGFDFEQPYHVTATS